MRDHEFTKPRVQQCNHGNWGYEEGETERAGDGWFKFATWRRSFSIEGLLSSSLSNTDALIRLPSPYKSETMVKANRLSRANPQVLSKEFVSLFRHPALLPLAPTLFFRIVTIVPFTLPVDWSLLSRPTNQVGFRHLCKPASQWQVSLRGRRLNNAGGTPRRLAFSLLLPVSFHVGPDSFLN